MALRRLPPEIWERIIDCLYGQYHTLQICTQVCRNWRRQSLQLLPEKVRMRSRDDVLEFSMQRGHHWKGPRKVRIYGGSRDDEQQPVPHLSVFLAMLAGRWTRLQDLKIFNAVLRPQDLSYDVFHDLASGFSFLTGLRLENVTLPSIATFRRLLSSLPKLRRLRCWPVDFARPQRTDPLAAEKWAPEMRLFKLWLYGPSWTEIARVLTSARVCSDLSNITITDDSPCAPTRKSKIHYIQQLLKDTGHSLRILRLNIGIPPYDADAASELHGVDLSMNTSLRQLMLTVTVNPDCAHYDWIVSSLSTLSSTSLHAIGIIIDFSIPMDSRRTALALSELGEHFCAKMDDVVAGSLFEPLTSFTIMCRLISQAIVDDASWTEVLRARMPVLCERDILKLQLKSAP